jgi:hypothetical protein
MSSLDTRRILGSTGRLSRISCGFAWLLRLDKGVAKGVSCVADERFSEGVKTRFDTQSPVVEIVNAVGGRIVGSDGDTVFGGMPVGEVEGLDAGSIKEVRDASNLFEFIVHLVWWCDLYRVGLLFKFYSSNNINAIAA